MPFLTSNWQLFFLNQWKEWPKNFFHGEISTKECAKHEDRTWSCLHARRTWRSAKLPRTVICNWYYKLTCTQWAHNVKMTSYQRRCDVITSHRRWYDVILMLCACWVVHEHHFTGCHCTVWYWLYSQPIIWKVLKFINHPSCRVL